MEKNSCNILIKQFMLKLTINEWGITIQMQQGNSIIVIFTYKKKKK